MLLFELGRVVLTPGAVEALLASQEKVEDYVRRHVWGDWGELEEKDKKQNALAVLRGHRILSVYTTKNGVKFFIVTEGDRSATTLLLPSEY